MFERLKALLSSKSNSEQRPTSELNEPAKPEPELCAAILETLLDQRKHKVERGFYWENQIAFAYNSQKIEGSVLTPDQTRAIFETGTIGGDYVPISDVAETANHFRLFDYMLDTLDEPLTKELIKQYHAILKDGTADARNKNFVVGGWKTLPNAVGGHIGTPPADVEYEMTRLLDAYSGMTSEMQYRHIAFFHVAFERIHPFQDGNGRVGRMIAFRECLKNDLVPFIVLDEHKARYYEGLSKFDERPQLLNGFFSEMRSLYLMEFTALIPEHLLLPRYKERYVQKVPDFAAQFEEWAKDSFDKKQTRATEASLDSETTCFPKEKVVGKDDPTI